MLTGSLAFLYRIKRRNKPFLQTELNNSDKSYRIVYLLYHSEHLL